MKNKYIIIISCIILIFNIGCKISDNDIAKKEQEISNENSYEDNSNNKNINIEDIDTIFKNKDDLEFIENIPILSKIIDTTKNELLENENSFDIFIDKMNREYFYFSGTNIQCGFKDIDIYGKYIESENILSSDEIILLAKKILLNIVNNASEYNMSFCKYLESEKIYLIKFSYQIQNTDTDDDILLYFRTDGTLGAYSAYRIGKYNNLNIKSNIKDLIEKYSEDSNINPINTFLSQYGESLYIVLEGYIGESDELSQFSFDITKEG